MLLIQGVYNPVTSKKMTIQKMEDALKSTQTNMHRSVRKERHLEKYELLNGREKQILEAASAGFTDRETAEHLGISVNTVATYWKRLYNRFGSKTRAQAVAEYALWKGPSFTGESASFSNTPSEVIASSPVLHNCQNPSGLIPMSKDEWRHWINTPLQHILGLSSLLTPETAPSDDLQKLEIIQLSAEVLRMRVSLLIEAMDTDSNGYLRELASQSTVLI